MGKSKRQLADEAYLRVNTPDNTGTLPGQLDIEGQIAAEIDAEARVHNAHAPRVSSGLVPQSCPDCGHPMTLAHGWAYSREAPWTIQCPRCGARFEVEQSSHATYREAVRAHYASLPRAPLATKKKRSPRTRGTE